MATYIGITRVIYNLYFTVFINPLDNLNMIDIGIPYYNWIVETTLIFYDFKF